LGQVPAPPCWLELAQWRNASLDLGVFSERATAVVSGLSKVQLPKLFSRHNAPGVFNFLIIQDTCIDSVQRGDLVPGHARCVTLLGLACQFVEPVATAFDVPNPTKRSACRGEC